jgi:uncharacterized membrane protein
MRETFQRLEAAGFGENAVLGVGAASGVILGAVVGLLFGNVGLGVGLGICFGAAVAAVLKYEMNRRDGGPDKN